MRILQFTGSGQTQFNALLAGIFAVVFFSFFIWNSSAALAQSGNGSNIASSETRAQIELGREELDENNYPEASEILTKVIRNERTPPEWMAIAFFYRGIANRMTGQNPAAVADFINALWLGTLPEIIKSQAYFHRAYARAAMGELDEALADLDEAAKLSPDEPRIIEARNQLLGISDQVATGTMGPAQSAAAVQNALGGIANTEILAGDIPTTVQPRPPTPARQVSLQPENNPTGFRIQLGALGSRETATAEWQRILRQHQDILGNLTPSFQTITQDGNSLVRLQAGPTASLPAARNLCALLKGRGQDCIAVGR